MRCLHFYLKKFEKEIKDGKLRFPSKQDCNFYFFFRFRPLGVCVYAFGEKNEKFSSNLGGACLLGCLCFGSLLKAGAHRGVDIIASKKREPSVHSRCSLFLRLGKIFTK